MKTLLLTLFSLSAFASGHSETCVNLLDKVKGPFQAKSLQKVCVSAQLLEGCSSVKGTPIIHFDKTGVDKSKKRILVFSLIHGDEAGAGALVRYWMERLAEIEPRNDWRIVPVLNPDGFAAKTRTNANKVDLNRNFPTRDWNDEAQRYWKIATSSNPRRYPGPVAGGEPEVQCALKHVEDFKPAFVVSIHTPLGVLDFDGPRVTPPAFEYLPWKSLGHFTGSLGRFLWAERSVPVLTAELRPTMPSTFDTFDRLQDVLGQLAKYELNAPHAAAASLEDSSGPVGP
ncbi:MAG: DUF2817 domain-containing protein [Bdellovibrionales bacterium]